MKYAKLTSIATLLGALGLAISSPASAATTNLFILPTVQNTASLPMPVTQGTYQDANGVLRPALIMNGIPIAFKYEDYWSYSAPLLDAIQTKNPTWLPTATFGTYDFSVGTGTIAVNLTTNAGGATNVNPNGSGVNFQDPVDLSSSDPVQGWTGVWGGNTQSYTDQPVSSKSYSDPASAQGGTSTVGEMLTYLHTLDPLANIPVFYADYNQTGSGDSLFVSAKVEIWDSTQTILRTSATWNLDRTTNGVLDINAPTFNYGVLNFYGTTAACNAAGPYDIYTGTGCAGVTANGDAYSSLDHNKGSGKPDFLVYSPDMDLSKFDPSDLFVFTVNVGNIPGGQSCLDNPATTNKTENIGCNTNGGEEFGIVGAFAPNNHNVPEPAPLALVSAGLGALAWVSRRRRQD